MNKKALLLIIPFAAAGLAGCERANPNPPGPTPDPQCESATVNIKSAGDVTAIKPTATLQLTAEVNISGCTFSWSSSDSTIATVDPNGLVTGVKAGDVVINYGPGSFNLKVDDDAPIPPVVSGLKEAYEAGFAKTSGATDPMTFSATVVAIRSCSGEYFIQDGEYGIDLYHPADADLPKLEIGKKVKVTAALCNYKGLVETSGDLKVEADGDGVVPQPANVASKAALDALKTNVLANAEGIVVKKEVNSKNNDTTLTVTIGGDDVPVFFKGGIVADYTQFLNDATEGANVVMNKVVVGDRDGRQLIIVDGSELTASQPTPQKEVKSLAIAGEATKTSYHVGDSYSAAGLSVVATYIDDTSETVSVAITPNKAKAELGDTSVTFSATFGGQTATKDVAVTVSPVEPSSMKDAYEAGEKATTGESAEFVFSGVVVGKRTNPKNVEFALQDGIYGIDIFNPSDTSALIIGKKATVTATLKNYKGLVETATIKSVVAAGDGVMPEPAVVDSKDTLDSLKTNVLVNASGTFVSKSATSSGDTTVVLNTGSSAVDVFIKSSLVSKYSFLDSLVAGDELTIQNGIVTAFNTKQIGIYDDSVFQKGQPTPQKEVKSIAIAGEATKTSYYVGDAYSSAGLSVVATYTDDTTGTVSAAITPNKAKAELGDTSVTFSASFGGKTATKDVTVTVTEAPADPVVGKTFVKVTSQADLTEGTYILGSNGMFFHGADEADKSIAATETDNTVVGLAGMAGLEISETTGGYSLKLINGANKDKYMSSKSGNDKSIAFSESPADHTITFNDGVPTIGCGDKFLKFNDQSGQNRFRYYASGQKDVALYKLGETKKVESVAISGSLTKPTQYVGDTFDPTGLTVTAMYEGGETADVTSKATWSVGELTTANPTLEVTASFGGKTSNAITVAVEAVSLTSMEIVVDSETVKKNYVVGDAWSSQGISVKGHYNNGSEATLNAEDYELSYDPTAPAMGVTEVEVTAAHKTAELTPATTTIKDIVVTAEAQPELDSIVVKTNPTKMTYNEGESFDPAGLVITASYTLDKASEDKAWGTDGLTYSYAGPLKAPSATVTISYTEGGVTKSTTITITVTSSAEHGTTEDDPLNADEAYAISDKLESGAVTDNEYYIEGTVSKINAAYSADHGNISLDLKTSDGNTFVLYRVSCTQSDADNLVVGTLVKVKAKISRYNSTRETNAGGLFVLISNQLSAIEISGSAKIQKGTKSTYTAVAVPSVASLGTVTWSIESGDSYISLPETKTGSSIEVTAVAAGNAVLKATSGEISKTFTITVSEEAAIDPYEGSFSKNSKGNTNYGGTFEETINDIKWKCGGNNTLDGGFKMSTGKTTTANDRAMYNEDTFENPVSKFVVITGKKDAAAVINSVTLFVYGSLSDLEAGTNQIDSIAGTYVAESEISFDKPTASDWDEVYFKVVFNLGNTNSGSNSGIYIVGVRVEF